MLSGRCALHTRCRFDGTSFTSGERPSPASKQPPEGQNKNASPLFYPGVRRKYTLHGSTLLAGSHSVTSCRLCLSVTGKPRPGPPGRLQSGTAAAFHRTLPPSGPLSIRRSAVSSLSVPFYTGSVALDGGNVKGKRGKVHAMEENPTPKPPLHPYCRCVILPMERIAPGDASKEGGKGADYWQFYYGRLLDYYISKEDLEKQKWRKGEPPARYAPGKMVFGGVYNNENGHLPIAVGRIWYEADLNYYEGKRNGHRLLFSNDGLLFVTYDHYKTFYELSN